jgi:hypothetical protein
VKLYQLGRAGRIFQLQLDKRLAATDTVRDENGGNWSLQAHSVT